MYNATAVCHFGEPMEKSVELTGIGEFHYIS